jgi:predicted RNA-binding protein YlqC (UPF0109 family)
MAKSISEFTQTLKQLGEVQVNDWDFMALLNKELDLGDSLRRLGNTKVLEWDFGSVMPTFHKLAHKEVELPKVVVRAAKFKVIDWDFRSSGNQSSKGSTKPEKKLPDPAEMEDLKDRLRGFLQFAILNLISEPAHAEIRIQEIDPGVLRFRVLVTQKDVKDLIGRNGATASAMRNLLKATAGSVGVHALLDILSHEEEIARSNPA